MQENKRITFQVRMGPGVSGDDILNAYPSGYQDEGFIYPISIYIEIPPHH
jgi:hypothetical protein